MIFFIIEILEKLVKSFVTEDARIEMSQKVILWRTLSIVVKKVEEASHAFQFSLLEALRLVYSILFSTVTFLCIFKFPYLLFPSIPSKASSSSIGELK